jgi:hypothetical protein
MSKFIYVLVACSVAMSAPVFAQDQAQPIVLKVDSGSILSSTGGEFVSAKNGQQVVGGQKLMVNSGSTARLVYDRGNNDPKDDCVIEYNKPGVYDVPSDCKRAVAWVGSGSSQLGNAAIIVGTGVVLAALIGNNSNDNRPTPPPVSLGNR